MRSWLRSVTVALGLTPNTSAVNQNPAIPVIRPWTPERMLHIRDEVRGLWDHGFNGYMNYAFPMDELQPISCHGRGPDWDHPDDHSANDVNGNFSATLIDVTDTFAMFAFSSSIDTIQSNKDLERFSQAVRDIIDHVSFDVNTKPQLFETTIRTLGGLLSNHIFASNPANFGLHFADDLDWSILSWYKGELLDLALDLGTRLLPAFDTPTKIPYARVNLRNGVPFNETTESCTAGATSLMLEFILLSRLTSQPVFERVAKESFYAIWDRRSKLGMVGNTIDVLTGKWTKEEVSGIGAGIDSFYEYAFKSWILTGEQEYLDVYNEAYGAIMKYSIGHDGFWYRTVNPYTGSLAFSHIDSLGAFWPGLMVLTGDIENAIKSHMMFWNLWRKYSGMPETFDIFNRQAISLGYPLRPEFVESTYFLYRVTRDPFYLDVGERILSDLVRNTKTQCGFATIANLNTGEKNDRMESYMLSETLKYLYLLFDESNRLHSEYSEFVFSTEGHILILPKHLTKPTYSSTAADPKYHTPEKGTERDYLTRNCRPYNQTQLPHKSKGGLHVSMRYRADMDYARNLVGITPDQAFQQDSPSWSPDGYCLEAQAEQQVLEYLLGPYGQLDVEEDPQPDKKKLAVMRDGFVVHNVTGVKLRIKSRPDTKGATVIGIGHYPVSYNQKVYFADKQLLQPEEEVTSAETYHNQAEFQIRLFVGKAKSREAEYDQKVLENDQLDLSSMLTAVSAAFGDSPALPKASPLSNEFPIEVGDSDQEILPGMQHRRRPPRARFGLGEPPIAVVLPDASNLDGCAVHQVQDPATTSAPSPSNGAPPIDALITNDNMYDNSVILIKRGGCNFFEKMKLAEMAGASGVIVMDPPADSDIGKLVQLLGKPLVVPTLDYQSSEEPAYAERHFKEIGMAFIMGTPVVADLIEKSLGEGMQLMVEVVKPKKPEVKKRESTAGKNLYVNGKKLRNAILLF